MIPDILQQLAELRQANAAASRYRQTAQARYHVAGELEISAVAEVHRTDTGAWVAAYVFIPRKDLQNV